MTALSLPPAPPAPLAPPGTAGPGGDGGQGDGCGPGDHGGIEQNRGGIKQTSGWSYRSTGGSWTRGLAGGPPQASSPSKPRSVVKIARSRWTRFGVPGLMVLLCLVAAAALAFPMISNWWASHRQHDLAAQLDDPALAGQVANGTVADGKPIGRIIIPAIGLDMVMVQGVDAAALASGPGHYPATAMPCALGDAAVAGHRTTFLHPFYHLDALKPGDVVEFQTAAWSCGYTVSQSPFSVLPTDTAVVADTPGQYTLTLTTCAPIGSSSHRLVVKARLVGASLHPTPAPSHPRNTPGGV